ncbi:hypothetical protein HPULCUR_000195 [Helicostylum pulchrum]|uniref:Uncharacterized protein n=1 Tax=Helicostylum pulchrum TaxID=562976 RepID=A0ABP9XJ66_9FUNG
MPEISARSCKDAKSLLEINPRGHHVVDYGPQSIIAHVFDDDFEYDNDNELKDTTKTLRGIIAKYKEAYLRDAAFTPILLPYAQQIALYEYTEIQTVCLNNIKAHFGNRLRSFLNELFKRKEKEKSVREEMQAKRSTDKYIKEAIRKQVYVPCNDMKSDVSKKNMPAAGALDDESRAQLNTFLSCYPENYTFKKDSIYYDVIVSPENHLSAFF